MTLLGFWIEQDLDLDTGKVVMVIQVYVPVNDDGRVLESSQNNNKS